MREVKQKEVLALLNSGDLKAVDLSFVPEKPAEKQLSDQEKMAQLEKMNLNDEIV